MKEKLVKALRDLAGELYQQRDRAELVTQQKQLDHAGLALEVLAHVVSGKTIERAFGAPGDWGYGTPIGNGLRAMLSAPRESVTCPCCGVLEWRYVQDELPDDAVQVCVSVRDPDGECYFFLGHHSAGKWVCEDELETPFVGEVYAWADVPEAAPQKKGGAA